MNDLLHMICPPHWPLIEARTRLIDLTMEFRSSPAFMRDDTARTESEQLRLLRAKCERLMPYVERLLAAQGDVPDLDLLRLQHEFADLLRPSSSPAAEHSTQR